MYKDEENMRVAEMLKVLGHPIRLCIARNLWRRGSCNVSHMQERLGEPQSTVSQQIAKLRAAGIVEGVRSGTEIRYEMVSTEAAKLLAVLFPEEEGQ